MNCVTALATAPASAALSKDNGVGIAVAAVDMPVVVSAMVMETKKS